MQVLIVEDEVRLATAVQKLLAQKGFCTQVVHDGEMGESYALLGIYDLIILDVMLPKKNGIDLVRHLRREHMGVPILMLTARAQLEDRVEGLQAGADYYLTKPFEAQELFACINALLRRQGTQINTITFGNTELDLSCALLLCKDKSIRLSAKEFEIMRFLFQYGTRNLSKETLLTKAWGYDSNAVENHVEVYIGFLRKKLESIGSDVQIETIRRLGYHLAVRNND